MSRASSHTAQVSFKAYLLTMTLALSAVPLLFLSLYNFQITYNTVKEQALQRDLQLTLAFSKELSAILESRVEVVKSLAGSSAHLLREFDTARLSHRSEEPWTEHEKKNLSILQGVVDDVRARSKYFDFMYVARRAGESLAISPLYSPSGQSNLGRNYAQRDYFQALVASESVAISQVQLGKQSRRPNIQIVAPIFSDLGDLIGLSEGSVDLKIIAEASNDLIQLDPSLSDQSGRLLVLDHYRQILVDSSREDTLLSQFNSIEREAEKPMIDVRADESVRRRDQREIFFDQTLWLMTEGQIRTEGGLAWSVIFLRDEAHLRHEARLSAIWVLIPNLLLTLLIVLLGLRLTRRLSQDVNALGGALDEIERDGAFEPILEGYPSLEVREWVDLFDHAHQFGATLKRNRREIESALEAEKHLNERQRSLLMALEFIQEGIEITDELGEVLYQNSHAERLSLSKRVSTTTSAYWHQRPDIRPVSAFHEKRERLQSGQTWIGLTKTSIQGEERSSEVTLSPQLVKGELVRVIVLIRDMTDEYKRREALQMSERLASIGSLASGIAHEVNNPLMYILANLDFAIEDLQRGEPSEDLRRELVSSLRQAKVGAEQVRDVSRSLLSIARHEGEKRWCSLRESIERCLRLVRTEVNHQSALELQVESIGFYYGNPSDLTQVLMNLIHNALHAMQETRAQRAPKLTIRVLEHKRTADAQGRDASAVIEVIDNGPGISDEVASRIFDPFFTTKDRGVGTGLGLSICQRIIHEMGGDLILRSELGVGSSFEISLPVALYLESKEVELGEDENGALDVSVNELNKSKILIVDDVVAITDMLCRQLKDKFNVESVNSGSEALNRLSDQDFDLILSDVMMPNMSGVELYYRATERDPRLKERFLFMTGGVLDDSDQRFFDRGDVVCLAKPVKQKLLIKEIETRLDGEVK